MSIETATMFDGLRRGHPNAGNGSLVATAIPGAITRINGVPSAMDVYIFQRGVELRVVEKVRSNAQGEWVVENLNPDVLYTAIIYDKDRMLNAAILDNLSPVVE